MTKRKPEQQETLLGAAARRGALGSAPTPLADRMRPVTLDEVVGQPDILASGTMLRRLIEADRLPSILLWGPPGSGKTTLANVIAQHTKLSFVRFSAVLGGVAELREIVSQARERRAYQGRGTLLFVDEIHRFNKSQQDAFLPHLEDGTVHLIGATTENPSFSVNAAVLSRCRVFHLESLSEDDLIVVLQRALTDQQRGLGARGLSATHEALRAMARASDGDARRALNVLEACADLDQSGDELSVAHVQKALDERSLLYDKSGEEHYNTVSAFIKSMRGSDPDAAIYWMMRMLEAGEDPLFVARRMLIFASEDVGLADPRALSVAVAADAAYQRLGMPEGIYPLSHACLYLASCPKSNSAAVAWQSARKAVREGGALSVPKKLRNAPTQLMKDEGYAEGYRYPHDYEGHHVPGETYLPDELVGARYYVPSEEGLEKSIKERLARLRKEGSR